MTAIDFTKEVLKFIKYNDFKDLLLKNNPYILITFSVLKLLISKISNKEHP